MNGEYLVHSKCKRKNKIKNKKTTRDTKKPQEIRKKTQEIRRNFFYERTSFFISGKVEKYFVLYSNL
jgi:hypothetical protein